MKNTGIEKIAMICFSVAELTDSDFGEARAMAKKQASYTHPLKNSTAKKYQDLGDHNTRVLDALQNLQTVIKND
jgi:hypothetical protein